MYIAWLAEIDKADLASAGGKGANLGELSRLGFPIPPGFVVTTAGYDRFVAANHLQEAIAVLATQPRADAPVTYETSAAQIRDLFMAGVTPADLADAIRAAYTQLVAGGARAVAVRSSATAEDLPSASFAGQQETYLNIQGEDGLLEAVRQCWASLWTARAMAYRTRQGIAPADVSLAVVVQQMVDADASGILFTANPVTGERDQAVIDAAWGLGEAIVGGLVTPDTVVVDKANGQIISRKTALKTTMTVRANMGVETQPVPPDRQPHPVLDNETAVELARYGAQIEAHYGRPMDIEWAIARGEIHLLQARPITNLPPAPLRDVRWDPPRPGAIWMRRQVVEHMPDPLSPLFDELYLQQGLDHSIETLTAFLGELSGIQIDVWDFVDPPFAATVNGYAYSIASFNFSPKSVPLVLRMYTVVLPKMIRHLVPRWRDESLPAYQAIIARWKSLDLSAASDEELLRGVRELAYEDAAYWFAAAVPLGLARATDAALERFLKSASKGERLSSGAFLRGFPSKGVDAQAELEAIARRINDSGSLRDLVLDTPAEELPAKLATHPDGQWVVDALQHYFDTYGHQIYNLDFAAPTLVDEPLPVLLGLKTALAHPERDARARQAALARERDRLVARTRRSLNPIQRPIFKRLLAWAQRYAPYREEALFYVGAAWPALRRLAFELGQRLTEAGSLYAPDHVFYLRSEELASASAARAQGLSRPDLAQLARDHRTLREARKRLDPPVIVPPDGRMKFGPIDMAVFEPKPRKASTGPILTGFAVSPGRITAQASVIRSPDEFEKMMPDTILVCTTTTPAWTPLFAQATGLVTDIGGALAHGSIVAREYGIPAVMGVGVATQRIRPGQMIRVDGDAGTVTLMDEADAEMTMDTGVAEKGRSRGMLALIALAAGAAGLLVWWKRRRRRE